jgi:hypothetical protein
VVTEEIALPFTGTLTRPIQPGDDAVRGTCGGGVQNGPERVFTFFLEQASSVVVSTEHPGTTSPTVITLRTACGDPASEEVCQKGGDGMSAPLGAQLSVPVLPPGRHYLIVESGGMPGTIELSLQVTPLGPPCSDGLDDDGDGKVDAEDPGCAAADDTDESDDAAGPTACSNGVDDDGDGLADHPYDPGCFGVGDDDEIDPEVTPACANGIDDDGDGKIDFPDDPGCDGRGDDREEDPPQPAACGNRVDDDRDGLVDEPFDPGCAGPGDQSEVDPAAPPACGNGMDDDGDGLADWPADPGCRGRGDTDEADPASPPACANHRDDDGDGATDWPADPGCGWASDGDEADPIPPPKCHNRFDDDQDGLVDWPDDPGCDSAGDNDEHNPPACGNGLDDDMDGHLDLADPGCESGDDTDETDPPTPPACANGLDDDMDGHTDWPDDPDCRAAGTNLESRACALDVPFAEVGQAGGNVDLPAPDAASQVQGSCAADGAESLLVVHLSLPSDIHVTVSGDGDPTMYVRRDCADADSEIDCDDDGGDGLMPALDVLNQPPGTYFFFVDHLNGPVSARVTITSRVTECNDGADNDMDGHVDLADPGCVDGNDRSEADPPMPPACANGLDDDMDGHTDYPDDPECHSAGGATELNRCLQAQVVEVGQEGGTFHVNTAQGQDHYESSCGGESPEQVLALTLRLPSRVQVETENADLDTILYMRSACDDAGTELDCDDDGGDGLLSMLRFDRLEPGSYFIFAEGLSDFSVGPLDVAVRVTALVQACADGADNDGDGLIDAMDPGCSGPDDADETDPANLPECADGVDNDMDGFVDLADLACVNAGGTREDQSCAGRDAPDITADGGAQIDNTDLPDQDATLTCGGTGAGDAVFRFHVGEDQAGGTLVASVANEGTAIDGAVVSVRRLCDDAGTELGCASGADGTVTLPNARPGDYYVLVDGIGPPLIRSLGAAINLPSPGPGGEGQYAPGRDISEPDPDGVDYWLTDSGEALGGISLWYDNAPTGISVAPGERHVNVNGLPVRVVADFPAPTVLRVRLSPEGVENGPVFVESVSHTQYFDPPTGQTRNIAFNGLQLPYLVTNDGAIDEVGDPFFDPAQIVFALVPSLPAELPQVRYDVLPADEVRIRGANIHLPAVLYFAPGYSRVAAVTGALSRDLQYTGDHQSSGAIQLSVQVQPAGQ